MAREINLNHITKIEGHASLSLKIENNEVKKCELEASEGARFFEALVIGKNIEDIQEIVSRICGICSVAHSVAAIQGLEEAIGARPSEQQKFIIEILVLGERIRSHASHLYFFSLPDYLGVESALALPPKHKPKVLKALQVITLGNSIVQKFGGREMHPFLKIQNKFPQENFPEMIKQLEKIKSTILETIKLFTSLQYKDITRESQHISLEQKNNYPSISGKIRLGSETFKDEDYKSHLTENIKEYATSKFVLHHNKTYSLGSISRISNNHKNLDPETKKQLNIALKKLNLKLPLTNPHHNLIAQAIELLEATNRIIKLLKNPPKNEVEKKIKIKAGHGVSAVEAPRGTLFHEYKINKNGIIEYCNIITPTAQNLNQMESDITLLVNDFLKTKTTKEQIVKEIEKLIRSYDPCFSCSTHFLKVNWL